MFKDIDKGKVYKKVISLDKTGTVKEDLFFQMLSLHGMDLPQHAQLLLKKKYRKGGENIVWDEAL
jgi:hypothetical protein